MSKSRVDEKSVGKSSETFSNTEKVILELMENFKINLKEQNS